MTLRLGHTAVLADSAGPPVAGLALPGWVGVALACAGLGAGVWLIVIGLLPARPRLSTVLAAALAPPSIPPTGAPATDSGERGVGGGAEVREGRFGTGHLVRLVTPVAHVLHERARLPCDRMVADLRVVGRSPVVHLATALSAGIAAGMAPVVLSVPLAVLGLGWLPAWLWLVCGAIGLLLPALRVRAVAVGRRDELRRAVSSVLDLTAIALAGGAGVEQGLHGAAMVGAGWAHTRLRAALYAARATNTDPWVALGRLGDDLGVVELTELGATLTLAGTEGARVRASLAAKATTLRAHLQTADEADAASATERMSLPVIVLFAGYLVFIGYPALSRVLSL